MHEGVCAVCPTHTVYIQVVYILLKCMCNKKELIFKNTGFFLKDQHEFNLIFSDAFKLSG